MDSSMRFKFEAPHPDLSIEGKGEEK